MGVAWSVTKRVLKEKPPPKICNHGHVYTYTTCPRCLEIKIATMQAYIDILEEELGRKV